MRHNEKYSDSDVSDSRDSESVREESEGFVSGLVRVPAAGRNFWQISRIALAILVISLVANILQGVYTVTHRPVCRSLYAKILENDLVVPYKYSTEYGSANPDADAKNALWAAIDVSDGFVALTHEESDELGLPRSEIFPWDSNKGMYLAHGYHALHCTTLIYAFTYDAHHGRTPLVSYHHIEHCLDLLRQDIMCHADDFLDFTGGTGDDFLVGDHQPRMCRDWDKLNKWLKDRTACYRSVNVTRSGEDHGIEHELERYTHCPPGSPYLPLIEEWRYLNRPNSGNLDESGKEALTEDDRKADAEAVAKHNAQVLGDVSSLVANVNVENEETHEVVEKG